MSNDFHDRNCVPHSSAPWYDETDSGYSLEIARRSVARAALNLGIDSMSGDALDGMGDVLVSFIERVSFMGVTWCVSSYTLSYTIPFTFLT